MRCLAIANRKSGLFLRLAVVALWLGWSASSFGLPAPDLKLLLTVSPNPVAVGELLTLRLAVTNGGSATASSVTLADTLPTNLAFFSGAVSQGSFVQNSGSVTGSLGTLAPGAVASLTLVVTPGVFGVVTNSATVTEMEADLNPADNSATAICTVAPLTFYPGPNLNLARTWHTATLLLDGRVLIAGGSTGWGGGPLNSAEIYNPATKTFTLTGNMQSARTLHAATLLPDGKVLITGGYSSTAEIYNPATGTFTTISNMNYIHAGHSATLLPDGRVLVEGSSASSPFNAAEVYVPSLQGFTNLPGTLDYAYRRPAVRLGNGKVLLAGGSFGGSYNPGNSGEYFDPVLNQFVAVGNLNYARTYHGAAMLTDGRVLFAGGLGGETTAELFYTNSQSFITVTNLMRNPHSSCTANRLADGKVLLAGFSQQPDLFSPTNDSFSRTADMLAARMYHTATTLQDGSVLITGGQLTSDQAGPALVTTEIYDPARTKPPPAVSVTGGSVVEGNAGFTNLIFQLNLSSAMGVPVSVNFASADGSATAGEDFIGTNGLATFSPGVTNLLLVIPVAGDFRFEPDETFTVTISGVMNAALDLANATATGTILNDDPRPTLLIQPASQVEGDAYTNLLTFMATLSADSAEAISIDYATANGTALAGVDYFPTNGTLTFNPGITNLPISVVLKSDIISEPDKVFYLQLTNAVNAFVTVTNVAGTIINDDGVPGALEHFELSTIPSPQYVSAPIPLTIAAKDIAGQTVGGFTNGVTLWATLTNAPWQEFGFEEGDFSLWTPLYLGNQPGPYDIVNFDVTGHGFASRAFRIAPNSGAADGISCPVTLQGGATYYFSVDLASAAGTGNGDGGTVHLQVNGIQIGAYSYGGIGFNTVLRTNLMASYLVPSNGVYLLSLRFDRGYFQADVMNYADNLRISTAPILPRWIAPFTNGAWSGSLTVTSLFSGLRLLVEDQLGHQGGGNVFDVNPQANLSLQMTNSPAVVRAGSDVVFTLLLTNRGPSVAANPVVTNVLAGDVTIRSATNNFGTATVLGNQVVFNVNTLTNGRLVTLTLTARPHGFGWFTNSATATSGVFDANLSDNTVSSAILPALPLLHVENFSMTEGDSGTNTVPVPVWLEGPVAQTISMDYATSDGTATNGVDYLGVSGTLVFPPDVTTQYVQLPIVGDIIREANKTILLTATNLINAVASQSPATLTINDNDPLPAVSIADVSVTEGNSGTTPAQFQVTLSNPSASVITILCSTTNGTATAPNDFISTTSTLTFPVGNTNQVFNVSVVGDVNNEPNQSFNVILSTPVNCSIARGTATGTILNDDAAPGKLLTFGIDPIPVLQYTNHPFPLTIRALDHLGQPATFSGSVTLAAQTDGFYVRRLFDDFEDGDLVGWTNFGTASLIVSNVTDVATNGTHSLKLTGKGAQSSYSYSLRYTISNSQPNKVSFYVRAAQTNAISGRIWAAGGAAYRAFDFYMNKDGRMGLYNNTTALATVPYTSNRWYRVDMDLIWGGTTFSSRKVNCRIDGVTLTNNANFLDDTYSGIDWIAVQNTEVSTSWFDDIHVYNSFPTNLIVSPTTAGPFNGGVWTGNVTLSQIATNVYLTVTDNAEHVGSSGLFQMLPLGLTLNVPATLAEGAAAWPATVSIPYTLSQPLSINLTSSIPSELTVPASVSIPAGETNVVFNLTVVDDVLLDGPRLVTISATASNTVSASAVITVNDNETATLSFVLPTTAAENTGVLVNQGRVNASAAPSQNITVTLNSSDTTAVQVPASVILSAGQTSAVFSVTIVDDLKIDGPQASFITASAGNWTGVTNSVTVTDNEDMVLRLAGPAQVSEGGGTANYTLRLSGTLTTNLTVDLASSLPTRLSVPPSAVFTAGQTSVVFTASIVDNANFDGAESATLSTTASGFTTATTNVLVLDNEIHHFAFAAIASPCTSTVPFSVSISARDIFGGLITNYSGTVGLSVTNAIGTALLQPTNVTITAGQWTGNVTLFTASPTVMLKVADTNGVTGLTPAIAVLPPTLYLANVVAADLVGSSAAGRLWALISSNSTLVPVDPLLDQAEVGVWVGDGANRIVSSGDGHYIHIGRGPTITRFDTLTRSVTGSWNNQGYSVDDFTAMSGNSDTIAVSWMNVGYSPRGAGSQIYDSGVPRISGGFGAGNAIKFGESPMRLYGYNNEISSFEFNLLRVGVTNVTLDKSVGLMQYYGANFTVVGRWIFATTGGIYDPERGLAIGGASVTPVSGDSASGRFFKYEPSPGRLVTSDLETLLPIASLPLAAITNATGTMVRWGSNGLAFRANNSTQLAIVRAATVPAGAPANLALSVTTTGLPAVVGSTFTYTMLISNLGPNLARQVVLAQTLPTNALLTSVVSSSGSYTQTNSGLICLLNDLPAGTSASVQLSWLAQTPGLALSRASVTSDSPDPDRTNNLVTLPVSVGRAAVPDSVVEIKQVTSDLVWNSKLGRLYASVPNSQWALGNSLLPLNPFTGAFDAPIATGLDPNKLAVSANGQYVYAGLDAETSIQRIDASNHVADLKFPTGYGNVNDLAVLPDNPAAVVATVHTTFVVYDNGVPRTNAVGPNEYNWPYYLDVASPGRAYCAYPVGLRRIGIDASGATLLDDTRDTLITGFDDDIKFSGDRLFTAGGRVLDPEAKVIITNLPYSGLVMPDVAAQRIFYLVGSGATWNLRALNFTNFQLVGSVAITNVSGTPTSLIRWGTDGLAFRTTGGQIFLVRTTLADDRDNDGLADSWELQYFASLTAPGAGLTDDPDHDGMNNLQEFQTGSNPLVYDSLRFLSWQMQTNGTYLMSMLGTVGQRYALLASTNLTDWVPMLNFTCTNIPTVLVDTASRNYGRRFYRIGPLASVPPPVLVFLSAQPLSSNGLALTLQGFEGITYRIEGSTNLKTWQTVTTFVSTNPATSFRDSSATNQAWKFYRAVVP